MIDALMTGPALVVIACLAAASGLGFMALIRVAAGDGDTGSGGIGAALAGLFLLGCGFLFLKGLILVPVGLVVSVQNMRKLRRLKANSYTWTEEDQWSAAEKEGEMIVAELQKPHGVPDKRYALPSVTKVMDHCNSTLRHRIEKE